MAEADVHFLAFLQAFHRFLEDVQAGRVAPHDRERRKLELHELAVEGIEGYRAEHRRGWGHGLVLWALKKGGRHAPPPPTPGRYLLNVLRVEYPEAVRAYERFVRNASEGTAEPSTDAWLDNPWRGFDP